MDTLAPPRTTPAQGSRLARELKEKPRKAVTLAVLLAGATWLWAGTLLGGGRARPGAAAAGGRAAAEGRQGAPADAPKAIGSFETALEHLQTWRGPLGLHLDHKDDEVRVVVPELPEIEESEPFPGSEQEPEPLVAPALTLTGTALTEEGAFALFQGVQVKQGGAIGRYRVVAVRPREADLSDGRTTWTLSMPTAGLGDSPEPIQQEEE